MNEFDVVDVLWFTGQSCIGVVLTKTEYGHKAYIGVGNGNSEQEDIENIMSRGSRFYIAHTVWPSIKDWAE